MRIFLSFIVAAALFVSPAFAEEWYKGGTLHGATIQQWNAGTEHDRIATSGDWIHVTTDNKYIKQAMATDPEILHQLAIIVALCVTESAKGVEDTNLKASTLVVFCLGEFKEQNPKLSWLLSK